MGRGYIIETCYAFLLLLNILQGNSSAWKLGQRLSKRQITFLDEDQPQPNRFPVKLNPCKETGSKVHYFHEETQRCYEASTQGPCRKGMIFNVADTPDEVKGHCHCDHYGSDKTFRTQVYDLGTKRCFPIFTQGPCAEGDWLTLLSSGNYGCEPNPCLDLSFDIRLFISDMVMFNDRCVRLGTPDPDCLDSQKVQFVPQLAMPTCASDAELTDYAAAALSRHRCKPGMSRAPNGKCVKNFFWK